MSAWPSLSTSATTGSSRSVPVVLQVCQSTSPVVPRKIRRYHSSLYTTSAEPSPSKSNTELPVWADEQSWVCVIHKNASTLATSGSMALMPSITA
jgi:hypothetical protein